MFQLIWYQLILKTMNTVNKYFVLYASFNHHFYCHCHFSGIHISGPLRVLRTQNAHSICCYKHFGLNV